MRSTIIPYGAINFAEIIIAPVPARPSPAKRNTPHPLARLRWSGQGGFRCCHSHLRSPHAHLPSAFYEMLEEYYLNNGQCDLINAAFHANVIWTPCMKPLRNLPGSKLL